MSALPVLDLAFATAINHRFATRTLQEALFLFLPPTVAAHAILRPSAKVKARGATTLVCPPNAAIRYGCVCLPGLADLTGLVLLARFSCLAGVAGKDLEIVAGIADGGQRTRIVTCEVSPARLVLCAL